MEKSNVPIGTVIGFDGDGISFTVEVKEATKGCSGCHYYCQCIQPPKRKVMPCFSSERTDGKSVFYPDCKL